MLDREVGFALKNGLRQPSLSDQKSAKMRHWRQRCHTDAPMNYRPNAGQ